MKNWLFGIIAVILLLGLAIEGVFYFQINNKLQLDESRLSGMSTDVNTVKTGIASLDSDVSTVKTGIANLNTDVNTVKTGVTNLTNETASLSQDMSSLQSSVGSVSSYAAAIAALQTSSSSAVNDINTLKNSISALQSSIGSVSTYAATIAALQSSSSSATSDINTLKNNIATINSNITSIGNSVAVVNTTVASLQTTVVKLQGSITSPQGSTSVANLVAGITPSLVFINVSGPRIAGSATGIVISNKGYILTCYHVIAGVTSINITLSSGQTVPATVVTSSQGRDTAILKLNTVPANLQAAVLGSSSSAATGDGVVSAGFALGYTAPPSFTTGIISAFRKLDDGYNYIQTDAAINPGDSGGVLLNMKGEVIGVNDAREVWDDNGDPVLDMGYCIPIDEVKSMIQSAIGS